VGTIREPTPQSPTPILSQNDAAVDILEMALSRDKGKFRSESDNFDGARRDTASMVFLDQTNPTLELCEIWVGRCPLVSIMLRAAPSY